MILSFSLNLPGTSCRRNILRQLNRDLELWTREYDRNDGDSHISFSIVESLIASAVDILFSETMPEIKDNPSDLGIFIESKCQYFCKRCGYGTIRRNLYILFTS